VFSLVSPARILRRSRTPGRRLVAMDEGNTGHDRHHRRARGPHLKSTTLHGTARHGCEDRELGRQIPTSAESAWDYRCKRRRKVPRLIGSQPPNVADQSRERPNLRRRARHRVGYGDSFTDSRGSSSPADFDWYLMRKVNPGSTSSTRRSKTSGRSRREQG